MGVHAPSTLTCATVGVEAWYQLARISTDAPVSG
jgi:hypothetical protein